MHFEVILVLDKNFLTNNNERITLENDGFKVVIKESNIVPGIQVADLVAGAFGLFDKGNRELLNIILSRMCQYSKDSVNTPSQVTSSHAKVFIPYHRFCWFTPVISGAQDIINI